MSVVDVYSQVYKGLGLARFNFSTDVLRVILLGGGTSLSYTGSVIKKQTDEFYSDIKQYEVVGTGYTAGGQPLVNVAWNYDATRDAQVLTADPVSWPAANLTSVYSAVAYKSTGDPSTSPLLCFFDFEGPVDIGPDFILNLQSPGLFQLRAPQEEAGE